MNKENANWHLNQVIKEARFVSNDQLRDVLSTLMLHAEWIIDEHKRMRGFYQKNDKDFKFWQHICAVERGQTSVIIRWRKFQGKRLYSEPLSTSELIDYKMPMTRFKGCTVNEKRTILATEQRFAKVRRINEKLSLIHKCHQALFDMTREHVTDKSIEKDIRNSIGISELPDHQSETNEFTEEDRIAFRKSCGL
jgi:hypothetical protein